MKRVVASLTYLACLVAPVHSQAQSSQFSPPGELEPNSGVGVKDATVYYEEFRFPLEVAPAFLNSQVYRSGGKHGPAGGQCSAANYAYPWRDNFCEKRRWPMPLCPGGTGHQGQDIRPATCRASAHWAVAAEDAIVAHIGSFSVTLQTAKGTIYRYLHLNMRELAVGELATVRRGDRIGKVSNDFGGASTTIHLHFDIKDTVDVKGKLMTIYVPPYPSLVRAYERLLSGAP